MSLIEIDNFNLNPQDRLKLRVLKVKSKLIEAGFEPRAFKTILSTTNPEYKKGGSKYFVYNNVWSLLKADMKVTEEFEIGLQKLLNGE